MEAQPTACTWSGMILRIRLTWLTSTVMPRSLKDPVWLFPHCLTHKSFMPSVSLHGSPCAVSAQDLPYTCWWIGSWAAACVSWHSGPL